MKKIIICVITFIVSITAGVGSFAVNDLGSYQQWMDDNRPLIKANLHKDKSHKENKHEKDSKHNKHDKHDKKDKHEKQEKHISSEGHDRKDRHDGESKNDSHEKREKHEKHNHRDVNKQHPKEERHEVSVPVKETNNPEPNSLPAPDAMPSDLSEESAGQQ